MNVQLIETLPSVRASLNYLRHSSSKPYSYAYEPPPGVAPRYGEVNEVGGIVIRDARPIVDTLSLDAQGFVLRPHPTAVRDFYDEEELRRVYYPEVEALLKRETGAEKVLIFDHTIRSVPKAREGIEGMREPVRRVHNDYTTRSGPRRLRDHLEPEEAARRFRHRFAEVNVWRPIRGPLEDAPLAVCDARTIDEADFIPSDLIYRDKVGETYAFSHNPNHRWFYFPRMRRDEALLLKGYDSAEDGRARFTAHTAFDDPSAAAGVLPRESIEVRALVFFPADG